MTPYEYEGRFRVGQVCLNGHPTTGSYEEHPEYRKDFCEECGAETITKCQECGKEIRGNYESSGSGIALSGGGWEYEPPSFCRDCGEPFPWTAAALNAAQLLVNELDELDPAEQHKLKSALPDLLVDGPRTPVAVLLVKKAAAKIGSAGGQALMKLVTSIATAAARQQLGIDQ
jgi:hypothetical protein